VRKILLITLVLALSAIWLEAQDMGKADNMSKTTTVQGCLQAAGGRYSLKASDGMIYKLTGEADKLKEHVGHEVEITGTPAMRAKSTMQEGSASTASEQHMIRVTGIKHIAATCSAGGSMSH
jgi:hypothetical protein